MTDGIFRTWKEIARYVKQNVRTCQRWEKELKFPVHRLEGYSQSRVFAYKEEIDAWMSKRLNNHQARQSSRSILKNWKTLLLFLPSAAAIALIIFFSLQDRRLVPVDFSIENSALIILAQNNDILGRYQTEIVDLLPEEEYRHNFQEELFLNEELRLPWIGIYDINEDLRKEIIFCKQTLDNVGDTEVFCLSERGVLLWKKKTGGSVTYRGEDYSNDYNIDGFGVEDINNDGYKEVIVFSSHRFEAPSQVLIFSHKGEVLLEYWNFGIMRNYYCYDLDQDGCNEVLFCGVNDEWYNPFCACFCYAETNGDEVETGSSSDSFFVKYFIRFPSHSLDESGGMCLALKQIQKVSMESDHFLRFIGPITYEIDPGLKLKNLSFSHRYKLEHQKYKAAENQILLLDRIKDQLLRDGLQFYDGENWVGTALPVSALKAGGDFILN